MTIPKALRPEEVTDRPRFTQNFYSRQRTGARGRFSRAQGLRSAFTGRRPVGVQAEVGAPLPIGPEQRQAMLRGEEFSQFGGVGIEGPDRAAGLDPALDPQFGDVMSGPEALGNIYGGQVKGAALAGAGTGAAVYGLTDDAALGVGYGAKAALSKMADPMGMASTFGRAAALTGNLAAASRRGRQSLAQSMAMSEDPAQAQARARGVMQGDLADASMLGGLKNLGKEAIHAFTSGRSAVQAKEQFAADRQAEVDRYSAEAARKYNRFYLQGGERDAPASFGNLEGLAEGITQGDGGASIVDPSGTSQSIIDAMQEMGYLESGGPGGVADGPGPGSGGMMGGPGGGHGAGDPTGRGDPGDGFGYW